MREILKEHFILLLGIGLFTYGLFSFRIPDPSSVSRTFGSATYHCYDLPSLTLLSIGAVLIVIGLLKIRKKKDKN